MRYPYQLNLGLLAAAVVANADAQTLFVPGGTEGIAASSNSYVGIGTNAPQQLFTIQSASGVALLVRGNTGGSAPHTASLIVAESNIDYRGRGLFLPTSAAETGTSWFVGVPYSGGGFQIGNSDTHAMYNGGGPYTKQQARLFVTSTGYVGIGTTSPGTRLQVQDGDIRILDLGNDQTAQLILDSNSGSGDVCFFNQSALKFLIRGGVDGNGANLDLADRTTGHVSRLFVAGSGNVGIGTTNPTQKLSVNGTIRAKEVIVEASPWPDYVFSPDYELPTLDSVKAHIIEKRHLPGVPPANAVAEQGVSVGQMQGTLMRKIEELTLYIIELSRENEHLKNENQRLQSTVEKAQFTSRALETRIARIEELLKGTAAN